MAPGMTCSPTTKANGTPTKSTGNNVAIAASSIASGVLRHSIASAGEASAAAVTTASATKNGGFSASAPTTPRHEMTAIQRNGFEPR